ncbi:DNA-binding transcriptional regulator, FadR family [Sphingomonas sp. YR710]|uniref:FadR/GntR family transcriptional regulator n=1 Tax=Sphingomonas sp. YR710 TaxID=1882773 RepID=UPI000884D7E4|nr:FCD domain-containing protein [Sphingomonas sp. YR710]SDD10234.1 DNA-binding transcriptional regulator, FadR family [Sphingomonas sp. YR710]
MVNDPSATAKSRDAGLSKPSAKDQSGRRSSGQMRRTEKVSEVIAREIVRDSRGLPPGTMLPPEAKLLERYRVSRASLREALRMLEVQGLVVIRPGPGGGPMIAEADSWHFGRMASLYFHLSGATYRNTLEARLILEPVVARLIAQQQDPEHIQALKDYLDHSKTTMEGKLPPSAFAISEAQERVLEFHAMLMSMTGNPVITLLVRSLQDLRVDHMAGDAKHLENDFLHVHDMIARAIIDGRAAQAEQLMHEHIQDFIQYELVNDPAYLEQTVSWR